MLSGRVRRRVTKVREFQQLARLSEADGHLQQRLKQLLKLSKEKWDAACEHAKTAVQARARQRSCLHHGRCCHCLQPFLRELARCNQCKAGGQGCCSLRRARSGTSTQALMQSAARLCDAWLLMCPAPL